MSPEELLVSTKDFNLVFDEIQRQPQTTIEQPKGKYRPKKQLQRDIETVKSIGLQRDIDTTRADVEQVVLAQRKAQLEINLRAKQEATRFLENQKAQQEATQKAQQDAVQNIILPIGSVPETALEQPKGKYRPKKNIVFDTPLPPSGLPRKRVPYIIPQVDEPIRPPSTIRQPKPKSSPIEPIPNIPKESVVGMSPEELLVATKEFNLVFDESQPQTTIQPKGKYRPKRSVVPDTIPPPPPSGSPRKRPPPSSGPPRKRVVHYLIPQAEEQTKPPSTILQPKPKASPIEPIPNIPKGSVVGMSPYELQVAKEVKLSFEESQPQTAPEQPKGKYRPKKQLQLDIDTVKTIGLQRDIDTTQSDVEKVLSQRRVIKQEAEKKAQQEAARLLAKQEAERLLLEQQEARILAQQEEARILAQQEALLLAQKEAENKSEAARKRLKALQKVEEVKQAYRDKKEKEKLQKEIDDQRTQLLARQEAERQEAIRQEEEQILQRYNTQKEETKIDRILPIYWKTTDAERQEIERQEAYRQEANRQEVITFKKKRNIVVNPPLPMTHNLSTPPPKSNPDPIFITPPPSQEEVITPTSSQESDPLITPPEKKKRAANRSKEEIAQEKADIEKRRIERAEKKEKEEKEKEEKAKAKEEKAKAKEEKATAKANPKPPIQGKGLLNHREQTTHRFKVLKGELLAGNTSKLVVNEMRTLVKQLVQMRELTNDQCQLILKELKTV